MCPERFLSSKVAPQVTEDQESKKRRWVSWYRAGVGGGEWGSGKLVYEDDSLRRLKVGA